MMEVKVQKGWLLLPFLIILFSYSLQAQDESGLTEETARQQSERQIQELKDGILILRLPSKNAKIKKLEELAASPKVETKTKKRLQKELTQTIENRNQYNLQLTSAFKEHYSFSQVFYLYDTAMVQLNRGVRQGIFINENLEVDPQISIPNDNYYVLRLGTTDASTTSGVDALVVMDNQGADLKRPFPYYVRANSFGNLFVKIFSPKQQTRRSAKTVAKRLDTNLKKYYQRIMLKKQKQALLEETD